MIFTNPIPQSFTTTPVLSSQQALDSESKTEMVMKIEEDVGSNDQSVGNEGGPEKSEPSPESTDQTESDNPARKQDEMTPPTEERIKNRLYSNHSRIESLAWIVGHIKIVRTRRPRLDNYPSDIENAKGKSNYREHLNR